MAGDLEGRDLLGEEVRHIERHLIGCASCRAERDSLNQAVNILQLAGSAPSVVGSSSNSGSLWPAVSRQIQSTRHPRRGLFAGMGPGAAAGFAASLIGVGAAIGLISWNLGSASATRELQANNEPIAPRAALPSENTNVATATPTNPIKSDSSRVTADVGTKVGGN